MMLFFSVFLIAGNWTQVLIPANAIPLNYTPSTNKSMIENLLGNKLSFHSVSLSGV